MTAVDVEPSARGGDAAPTVAGITAAVLPILERLRESAGAREATRDFAFDDVAELARRGVLLVGVPVGDGGAGGSLRDVLDLVVTIARHDSNIAQALRGSFGTAFGVANDPRAEGRERTLARIHAGDLFAGTVNERTGGPSGSVNTTLRGDADGYVVDGEKYYSTGGLYASWFSTTAKDEQGRTVRFQVPLDRAGVERVDDFDAIGQRLTASGTTRFTGVRLDADEVDFSGTGKPPLNPWGGLGHLYLCAVQAGIAYNALDDAIAFVHAAEDGAGLDDPYIQQVVGRIAAKAHAVRSAVLIAAEELERVCDLPAERQRAAGAAASITIAQTQALAAEQTLEAATLLFDLGPGTDQAPGFDRHWRNSRTIANHNPRDWKLAKAGAYFLTGEEPPTSGLF
ncbi:acyl-CoA dehydrogenase family protein [Nocardia sp. NPDC058176]|uniref:acyl-CoA dehydrogenase family protein n=1 Tax=Nocardia sp. NPDC058176 TaxID=3346368 RepID=UPI0036D7C5E6